MEIDTEEFRDTNTRGHSQILREGKYSREKEIELPAEKYRGLEQTK